MLAWELVPAAARRAVLDVSGMGCHGSLGRIKNEIRRLLCSHIACQVSSFEERHVLW